MYTFSIILDQNDRCDIAIVFFGRYGHEILNDAYELKRKRTPFNIKGTFFEKKFRKIKIKLAQ